MIKKYLEFINESTVPPGPNSDGVMSISLSNEETNMVSDEPVLSNMISQSKISLIGNTLYFFGDKETSDILNQYFPEQIK
jgi:hypothetical protein